MHRFAPSVADPGVTNFNDDDIALAPATADNGLLVVFLPGTGGMPACCTDFLVVAAQLGFHALGLQYANSPAVGSRCQDDLACYGTVRRNIFDGSDASAASAVAAQDTVRQRLTAALQYLEDAYPMEGWGAFGTSGPAWPRIVLAGHSQGGGEADFISTLTAVRGVVALSSPPDTNSAHVAAFWLTANGMTPASRIIGFVHAGDPFEPRILADWAAMGLGAFGTATSADGDAPYGGSHELISSVAVPNVVLAAHDSTAVDSATPLCADGAPRYATVWRYMLEVAAQLPQQASSACSPAG